MFYATRDAEDGRISQNANIEAFETDAQARAYLLGALAADEWVYESAVIEPGRYGDAWIVIHSEPKAEEGWFAPFVREQLAIAAPGAHPGGNAWWIEPAAPVLVLASIEPADA